MVTLGNTRRRRLPFQIPYDQTRGKLFSHRRYEMSSSEVRIMITTDTKGITEWLQFRLCSPNFFISLLDLLLYERTKDVYLCLDLIDFGWREIPLFQNRGQPTQNT